MALKGVRQHLDRLKRLTSKRFERDLFKALETGAERIRDDARASLADLEDNGELARSITIDTDPESLSLTITASAPHAADLEFGSSRIVERPFLAPAVEKHRAGIVKDVAAVVRKTMKKA